MFEIELARAMLADREAQVTSLAAAQLLNWSAIREVERLEKRLQTARSRSLPLTAHRIAS